MPLHAVVAVINFNGKILIGKKRSDSPRFLAGKWHIPGETVRPNESDEEALKRGMREKTGLEIIVGRYLASHPTPSNKMVLWYECFSKNDETIAGSNLEETRWVDKRQIIDYCSQGVRDLWPEEMKDYFR